MSGNRPKSHVQVNSKFKTCHNIYNWINIAYEAYDIYNSNLNLLYAHYMH